MYTFRYCRLARVQSPGSGLERPQLDNPVQRFHLFESKHVGPGVSAKEMLSATITSLFRLIPTFAMCRLERTCKRTTRLHVDAFDSHLFSNIGSHLEKYINVFGRIAVQGRDANRPRQSKRFEHSLRIEACRYPLVDNDAPALVFPDRLDLGKVIECNRENQVTASQVIVVQQHLDAGQVAKPAHFSGSIEHS